MCVNMPKHMHGRENLFSTTIRAADWPISSNLTALGQARYSQSVPLTNEQAVLYALAISCLSWPHARREEH